MNETCVDAATPEYFGSEAVPLLGWLHLPPRPRGMAVVLCPPLGHELIHGHRSLRALAQAIAARGLPVLRLDYAGTGDSADPAARTEPGGALPAWLASIDQAIAHLQQRSGVRPVALLGVRSGALLAGTVAACHPDVAALLALAPVVSGRRLLREWRALAASAALASQRSDGVLEVAGFAFDAQTCAALESIELGQLSLPEALAVRVIDRDDLPAADRWVAHLQQTLAAVQHDRQPGLAAMLDEPQRSVVPVAAVQAGADWLHGLAGPVAGGSLQAAPAMAVESALVAPAVRESVWRIGRQGHRRAVELMGIVTEPAGAAGAEPGPTVLLLNTGPVHHIGGHRLYVALARGLARRGCRVVRLDLSGLGDSPARPGEPQGAIYGPHAVDDVAQAVAEARQRWPAQDIVLLGLCAGAYHALKSAVAGSRAARAVIVNPLVYHWEDGMTLESAEVALQAVYYRNKWRRLESWKRLASGRSDVGMLARVVRRRLAGLAARLHHSLHQGPRPAESAAPLPREDLSAQLLQAVGFGTCLDFVFSQDEPGWPILQQEAAAMVRRLRGTRQLSVRHLPRTDHTFSTEDARQRFIACLLGILWPAQEPLQDPSDMAVALASLDMTRQGS